MVDVIDLVDSDEESAPFHSEPVSSASTSNNGGRPEKDDVKPDTQPTAGVEQDSKVGSLSEIRKRKIDQLMDMYIKYHHRLISVEYMMDRDQLRRWHSHLATSYSTSDPLNHQTKPNLRSSDTQEQQPNVGFASQESQPSSSSSTRPPWFIDPPSGVSSYSRPRAAGTARSVAPRRKYKRKKRRATSSRRTTTTKRTTTSRKTTATSNSTASKPKASASTSRPKASTSKATAERKPRATKLQAMLAKVKVKREA